MGDSGDSQRQDIGSRQSGQRASKSRSTYGGNESGTTGERGYPHFMLKEIFEQPDCINDCMRGRINADGDK